MAASSRHVVLTKHTGGDRRICIFDGYKYHFASKSVSPSKTRRMSRTQQHSPTQRLSWRCAHSGCHHMVYTSVDGMYVGDSKQHTDLDNHEVWSEDDIKTLHFRNELIDQAKSTNGSLLDCFKEKRRLNCDLSQRLDFSKFRSIMYRSVIDKWKPKNPSTRNDIFQLMVSSGYHWNWFGWTANRFEKMHGGVEQLDAEKAAFVKRLRDKESVLYIGDNGHGEFQYFCDLQHAKILKKAPWIGVDGSFKSAAKGKDGQVMYPQVMNVVGLWPGKDRRSVAAAFHSGTIHYTGVKCDKDTYLRGLQGFFKAIERVHGVDVLYEGRELSMVADMEKPLRQAVRELCDQRSVILKKFLMCWFHYSQAIGTNIGKHGLNPHFRCVGKKFTMEKYLFLRCYKVMALVHPDLAVRCWNLLKSIGFLLFEKDGIEEYCNFLTYHKKEYMNNIKEWNQYYNILRTNNAVECRNFVANLMFGAHPNNAVESQFCGRRISC
eukprot:920039_1